MKYTIRMKEDWVLLFTNLLLFGVFIAAAGQGYVFLALLFYFWLDEGFADRLWAAPINPANRG